jgi:hypothetical protein
MVYLIIAEEGKKRKLEITEDFLFIGTNPDNQVSLTDPKVAKQHCQILRTESGFRLLDLGSETGTWVNGQKIQQADLKEGDIIQLGQVKMALKEIPSPAQSPAAPAPVAGRRPTSRTGARRSKTRRRTPSRKGKGLPIKKEFTAASDQQGTRLVRRKLREGSKVPGWALGVLVFWVVVAVVVVVVYALKQAAPSPWQETYYRAQVYEANGDAASALAEFQKIPRNDPQWGEDAAKNAARIIQEFEWDKQSKDLKGSIEYFDRNIKGFIKKYIDGPPDKPSLVKKIARIHGPDRTSYIRVLIKRRIDHYLDRYPEGQDVDAAKKLRQKYLKEIDLSARPTFRDTEVEAETELVIKKYGVAYRLMDDWLKKYPDTKFGDRINWMKKQIWEALSEHWSWSEKEALTSEEEGNFIRANNIYLRYLSRCEGYDDPKALALQEDLQQRVDENNKRLEKKIGQKVQMELKKK